MDHRTAISPAPNDTAPGLSPEYPEFRPEGLSMGTLMRELNLRKRPFPILRGAMSALESLRMEKKMGWSRPWNKHGLNIFRSHRHDLRADAGLFGRLDEALDAWIPELPAGYREFLGSLRRDPDCMAFTFYHNHRLGDARYEGLTLSLGRKVPSDRSKRDRLDLVLEDLCVDGRVDGRLDRARLYVNPWSRYREGELLSLEWNARMSPLALPLHELYSACIAGYHAWKEDPARQWEHWSVRYIEYFGPRAFVPESTSFT